MQTRPDRILLVHPKDPLFQDVQKPFAPLCLACLAAYVEDLVEIKILDASDKDVDQVVQEVDAFTPQWVGITVPYTFFIPEVLKISQAIKTRYGSEVEVILGGHGVTFIPDEVLNSGVVDAVVRGEGELTFREMVEKGNFDVLGTSRRLNGDIHHNPPRPLIPNLDDLPIPAFHLLDMASVDIHQMETSRGCPFRCTFCDTSRFYGHRWRAKSPERVVQEFEILMDRYGASLVLPVDDNINTDMKRVDRICQLLLERDRQINIWIQMRADDIARNPETIERLAQVGTQIVVIGIESGSQETLNEIRKGTKLHQIVQASEVLRRNGIHVLGSYMIGLPHETARMAEQTVRFAMETVDSVSINVFVPYPGTDLYDRCKREGLLLTEDWEKYDQRHQVVKTSEWPEIDFTKLQGDLCRLFYNNAGWIKSHFVPKPGREGQASFSRNFYSAWAGYYALDTLDDWAEVIEGYRYVANPELGSRFGNYNVRLRLATDVLTMDLEIQGGQLQKIQRANGEADFVIRASNHVLNELLRRMTQDALSAFIEDKIAMEAPWSQVAAFVRWCDAFQEILDVQVVRRAPDEPTCLPALNRVITELPEPKPDWLRSGGRYLLKTDAGDLVLAVRGSKVSEFRLSTDGRLRRIRGEVSLGQGAVDALMTGDFRPLVAAMSDFTD